jgi:hypothetical protein
VLEERNNCQKEILELRSHLVKTEEYWQQQIARLKNDYETRLSKVSFIICECAVAFIINKKIL